MSETTLPLQAVRVVLTPSRIAGARAAGRGGRARNLGVVGWLGLVMAAAAVVFAAALVLPLAAMGRPLGPGAGAVAAGAGVRAGAGATSAGRCGCRCSGPGRRAR